MRQFLRIYVTSVLQDTLAHFGVSPSTGLPSASIPGLLERHSYNEFSVSAPEPLLIKFAKTIYENPLIILLCGSATVSAIMGNLDDAMSITIAVLIVLTGKSTVACRVVQSSDRAITVGFVQEQRSEKSLEALNKLVPHHCHLIRYVNCSGIRAF